MKGTLVALGLLVGVACAGGGSPNDFGTGPSDNAPTAPGAPRDPNAPPGDGQSPPFGGTAPPGPSVPGDGSTGGGDCTSLCNEAARACGAAADSQDIAECIADCTDLPGSCFAPLAAFIRCIIRNGCDEDETDACEPELLAAARCVGPGDGGGEGGQGGM